MKKLDMLTLRWVMENHATVETNVHLADQYGSPVLVEVALAQYDKLVEVFNDAAAALHHFQSRASYGAALNGIDIEAEVTNLTRPTNGPNDFDREPGDK